LPTPVDPLWAVHRHGVLNRLGSRHHRRQIAAVLPRHRGQEGPRLVHHHRPLAKPASALRHPITPGPGRPRHGRRGIAPRHLAAAAGVIRRPRGRGPAIL